MASFQDNLAQRALGIRAAMEPGSSSFYSRPTPDLDPRLFMRGAGNFHPEVRQWILTKLYRFWEKHYKYPTSWSTVWIAGSGVSHQWSGGRSTGDAPGDLDVLIGVDWDKFRATNPGVVGNNDEIAAQMNQEFFTGLWPETANALLPMGGAPFETTWFVNPQASDIRAINPYAAFNVTTNRWDVEPRHMREDWDPKRAYSKDWFDAIDRYAGVVRGLVDRFHTAQADVASQWDGSRLTPRGLTAASNLHNIAQDAHMLWADLHESRRLAFSPEGDGYDDFYSVRWQQSKQDGWAQPLKEIASLYGRASEDSLDDSQTVLRLAVQAVNSHG